VSVMYVYCFFFFQAEDGIRDGHVTGVQTCALPIFSVPQYTDQERALAPPSTSRVGRKPSPAASTAVSAPAAVAARGQRPRTKARSEERRVGKEGRARRGAEG